MTRRPSIKKDGMGTSEVFINPGEVKASRREASIVNLDVGKGKEKEGE